MTNQEKIIAWIQAHLGPERGAQAKLWRAVDGLNAPKLSLILKGERDVSGAELIDMARHFGVPLPIGEAEGTLLPLGAQKGQVPMVGRIGEEAGWIKSGESKPVNRWVNGVTDDRYPLEDQSAYELVADTSDGEYRAHDLIYTVPFAKYRSKPLPTDEVVVLREIEGFKIHSLRRAITTDVGIALTPLQSTLDPPPPNEKHMIVGLVIGFFRPKRNA